MTSAEKTARYQARKYAAYDALPKIECLCGCGTLIAPINRKGVAARYAHGHNPDGIPYRFQPGDTDMPRRGAEARRAAGKLEGSGHHNWRGGEWIVKGGYVRRTLSPSEAAAMPTALRHGNGWSVPRSHYVWNLAHPQNPVRPGEVIHHRDRVRDNDVITNLDKLTRREHEKLHISERRT